MARETKFGFTVGPVMPVSLPGAAGDGLRYGEVIADCRLGQSLGFESVWMLEHHFTDYYPSLIILDGPGKYFRCRGAKAVDQYCQRAFVYDFRIRVLV